MEERDYIKELFSEKLSKHEVPVNDALWNSISSQIVSKALVKTGVSLASKIIIGISAASVVGVVSLLVFNNNSESQEAFVEKTPIEEVKSKSGLLEEKVVEVVESKSSSEDNNFSTDVPQIKEIENTISTKKQTFKVEKTDLKPFQFKQIDLKEVTKVDPTDNQAISEVLHVEEKIEEHKSVNPIINEVVEKQINLKSTKIGNLPNFFSPNNDRDNDFFFIELEGLTDFSLIVLDKMNTKMFSSNDPNFKWDGKDFQNTLVPVGSYVYFFTGKDIQGNVISKSNTLVVKY